jgi:hypothetical protein
MDKCEDLMVKVDNLGFPQYYKCGKAVKWKIRNAAGKERCVCGTHYRSALSSSERIKRKTGFDTGFTAVRL